MKKGLFFATVAAMILPSCVQDESLVDDTSSAPKEITFQTVVAKQSSRALINGITYGSDAPSFGAWARYNPSDLTVGTMAFIENDKIEYLTDAANVNYWGINTNDGHETHHWPNRGSLTFYAYSPYYFQEDLSTESVLVSEPNESAPKVGQWGISFPNYDVHAHQQTDLMVADVQVGQTANVTAREGENYSSYTGVPTIFRHKLAVILAFKLATSEDYDGAFVAGLDDTSGPYNTGAVNGDMRFYIKSIKLKNIKTKGTYRGETYTADGSKVADKWEEPTEQELKEYTWYKKDEGTEFGYDATKNLNISWVNLETASHVNPTIYLGSDASAPATDQYHLLVLPQDFEDNKQQLEVTYFIKTYTKPATDPTTFDDAEACWQSGSEIVRTVDLEDVHPEGKKAWGMNQKITYTLKFSTTEIRWAPQVIDWTATDYTIDF